MLQQVMTEPGKIEFHEVPVPEISDREVLIKIMKIGICGSDIHVYHGEHPFTSYPVTQGHEVSGEVVKAGRAVTGLKPGQKVTIQPQVVCGQCYPCRHGKYNLCENLKVMGFQTTGVASHYFAVDAAKVTLLPDDMSYEQVMITDVSGLRLEKAKECGVDFCVNTRNKDFGEAMTESLGPDKADVIYDCAGNNITMGQAIKYARKGSIIILVAVFAGLGQIDLAVLNDHELDLNTSMMYRNEDYLDAIRLVNEKKVVLSPLISSHFAFGDYLKAYQYIDENRESTMKVIINVQE